MKKLNIALLTVLVMFQTILGPFGTYGVTFADGNTNDPANTALSQDFIDLSFEYLEHNGKKITKQADADGVTPKAGDKVKLSYTFAKGSKEMNVGDTFKFTLPKQLLIYDQKSLSGPINVGKEEYFTYKTDAASKEVTITATQYIPDGLEGAIWFEAEFGNFKDQNLEQNLEIKIPGKSDIDIKFTFEPKVKGENVSKEGKVRTAEDGTKYIDWDVWFNMNGSDLGEVSFTDTFDEGYILDGLIEVNKAEVVATLEGVGIKAGTEEKVQVTNTAADGIEFKVTTGKKAVQVKYTTKITRDVDQEFEQFKNSFIVTGSNLPTNQKWKAEKTVEVQYGKPLSKEQIGGDKYNAEWLIEFNKIGKSVPQYTTITDTLDNDLHKFDSKSIVVKKYDVLNGVVSQTPTTLKKDTDYTVDFTDGGKTFIITSKLPVGTYAFDITYNTVSSKEFITEAGVVNNKVSTTLVDNENQKYEISTDLSFPGGIGSKQLTNVDYANKTLEWTVTVGSDGKNMTDLVIADYFTDGLELIPYQGTQYFKIKSGQTEDELGIAYDTSSEINGEKGFIITFAKVFNGTVTFTYQTKYEVLNKYGEKFEAYKNGVNFKWDGETTKDNTLNKSAEFKPIDSHKNNSEKMGTYNYKEREFTWTANVNLDRNTLPDGTVIEDVIGDGHKLAGAVTVYEATVDKNGKVTRASEVPVTDFAYSATATGFKLTTINNTSKVYQIVYKTVDSDDIIGQKTEPAGEYGNTITIKNGNDNYGGDKGTVIIDRPNEQVMKTAKQNPAKSTVSWQVDVNKSNSDLQNVVLTDKPSTDNNDVEHWLMTETLRIQEIEFTETGYEIKGAPKNYQESIAAGWILPESNVDKNNGFTLKFGNLSDAVGPRAFTVTYETYYDGPHNIAGSFGNTASLAYEISTGPSQAEDKIDANEGAYQHNDSGAYAGFKRTNLEVTKYGKNNDTGAENELAKIEFKLYNKNKEIELQGPSPTGTDGKVTFNNIGYGVYWLKETKTEPGFVLTEWTKVTVKSGDSTTPFKTKVINDEIVDSVKFKKNIAVTDKSNVKFELHKVDEPNAGQVKAIKKSEFVNGERIFKPDTDNINSDFTFSPKANGEIYIPYLEPGKYYFKEVSTEPGYKLDETQQEFEILSTDNNTMAKQVNMDNKPIIVKVTNVEEGNPSTKIEGSTFAIYMDNSCPGEGQPFNPSSVPITKYKDDTDINLTTNSQGQITVDFSKLAPGNYVIVQNKVNKYYKNKENIVATCVVSDGKTPPPLDPEFPNERVTEGGLDPIELTKTDKDNNHTGISDVVIVLDGSKQDYVGKTGIDGKITKWYKGNTKADIILGNEVTAIIPDKYEVKEIESPAAYEKLAIKDGITSKALTSVQQKIYFDYNNDSKESHIEVMNEKIKRDIEIENSCGKEDETEYQLLDSANNPIRLVDAQGKLITGSNIVDAATGKVKIPANATNVVISNVHLPKGEYQVKQLTTSVNCEPKDSTTPIKVTPNEPNETKPVDETDKPIYGVTLTFKNCKQEDVAGTYTFKGTFGDAKDKIYTVEVTVTNGTPTTVIKDGNKVVTKMLSGKYTVTGDNTVERPVEITATSTTFEIKTENCGNITIQFNSCVKDNTTVTTVDIYKKDKTGTIIEETKVEVGPTNWSTILSVGDYVAYPGGTKTNGTDFTVTETSPTSPIIVNEPCNPEEIKIDFKACDKLGTTTVDIYKYGNTTTIIATVNVASNWKASLAEGDYVAYPGGKISNGTKFTVGKAATTPVIVTEPCGEEKITIEFDSCEKASPPTTSIDVYVADVAGNPTGTATVVVKDGNGQYTVDLDIGSYIAYPGGTKTNGTLFEVTKSSTQVITVTEPCPAEEVTIEFDRCEKEGRTTVDIYNRDTNTFVIAVDTSTAWKTSLEVGKYIAYPGGIQEFGTTFEVTKTTLVSGTIKVVEPCGLVPVEITLISCDQLGTTTVDIYEVDSNNQLISSSIKSVTVVNGKVTENLGVGSYVILLGGTTAFKTTDIIEITESTTGLIPVTITQDCKTATITFKSCDAPIGNTTFKFDDGKGNTFTTSTDNNGVISKTVPPGIYTVTNTTTNVSKVIDITSSITNLVITECEACIAQVKVPELADQTVTISNDSIIETVKVNENGEFTIPFTDGTLTVKDSTGKVVGTITVTDCKGTFDYPRCENPNILLPTYENQNMFILSEIEVDGVITSPDTTTIDVATITTSSDTVMVDMDGKLTIDKSKLTEGLEYYIVDSLGKILKVIKLDSGSIVVYTTNRDEETRIEECIPKNPISFEPDVVEPTPPGPNPGEPTEPGTPPGPNPGEPTDPSTPPTKPGEPTEPGTPPTKPGEPTEPGTPPTKPVEPTEPGTPPTKPVEPTEPGTPPTKPVEPTEPGTPPTKPGGPTEPGTPSTKPGGPTEPGTPSTNPTNPGTTTPPTLPGLERVIKTIPPAILPTPGSPLTPGELAGLVEKYSKDPSKLDALVNDLKGLVDYYESLSAEQKAEFEELYDVNSLNMMLDELEKVASLQMKLPQTDGASQFGMMLVGSALLLAGAWLFVTRRRKA